MQQLKRCLPVACNVHFCIIILLSGFGSCLVSASTVTNISAIYRNGQTFTTWTSPKGTNLQYNVYRSTSKFTSSSQLSSSTFLGFVRDSSSKNIRRTSLDHQNVFFKIKDNGNPLSASQGLYVTTSVNGKSYYYAVTVTTLSDNKEDKTITIGSNSLSTPVKEKVSDPLPVWQDSIHWSTGDEVQMYVIFGNNQEAENMPAFNSKGSYGYNFYVLKRGAKSKYALFEFYEGLQENSIKGNGLSQFMNGTITDCYIMGMDDWLPSSASNGDHTYWNGYHQSYDFYSGTNPVPSSGTIKTFSQRRYIYLLGWAKKNLPLDTSKVYLVGVSAGGFGVLTTAMIIPDQIAAVYEAAGPFLVQPEGNDSKSQELTQMWGEASKDLSSDIKYPSSENDIGIYELLDTRSMLHINKDYNLPPVYCVYGKNDKTILWNKWTVGGFDSLETTRCGGVFFWDQRDHDGNGANFLDQETTPDFYSLQTTKLFPAFSNCSIDPNLGTGDPGSGANYGALNGYLGWKNDITDENCKLSINVFIKDFYVGGKLSANQYSTCKSDITFRRVQHFHPKNGDKITWTNYDVNNSVIESGSFTYKSGLITLKGITIKKSGNQVKLTLGNCSRSEAVLSNLQTATVSYSKTSEGYIAHIYCENVQSVKMSMYDVLGRRITVQQFQLATGDNNIPVLYKRPGIYLVEWKGDTIAAVDKLLF
ncbi:MAG: hypothetical protein H0W62_01885 [Chitinophagales bacterium]|nr:hypothetical protein [Chitinophagales bacterium]